MSESSSKRETVVSKALGNNPLAESKKEEDVKNKKSQVWCTIEDLTWSARKLYVEKNMSFDEVLGHLADACKSLKGKEKELMTKSKSTDKVDKDD